VVSILAGWIYAQFALPSLFGMFCLTGNNTRNCKKNPEGKNYFDVFLAVRYAQLLRNCLQKPVHVFGITALLCATGLALLVTRPSSFVSSDLVSEIEVVLNFPPGTTIDSIAAEAAVLGEQLEALPGIVSVFGRGGSEKEDAARRSNPDYRKETFVFRCVIGTSNNSPRVVKPETVLASINTLLGKQYYETLARFPQDKTEKLLGLSPVSVIAVKGRNMEDLKRRAAETETLIQMNGLTFSRRPWGLRPEIRVIPDREASAHAGISAMETARALYAAAEGLELGKLELGGTPLTIKISAMDLPELEVLPVALSLNGPVFAGSIARFIPNETPAALARLDRSDVLYFECNPGSSVSHFAGGKELGLSRVDESAFTRYRTSLIVTVVMVLILLYLTMGAEFESLSLPLVLFLAIPFSLAGAGPALFLCNAGLDSSSILALMVLFGLSVNNGMVLYELALVKYSYGRFTVGRSAMEAVYDATVERFRPVLTTTLTTVFALLPLVISPMGTKEHSMAAAMLGGIAASTTLTLFALPPVLTGFLDRNRNL
jgi:multidrug efflux pump subunit AcrB